MTQDTQTVAPGVSVEREKFEAWYGSNYGEALLRRAAVDRYYYQETQHDFVVWMACTALLAGALPAEPRPVLLQIATPSPAQAEPTDEELLGNFRVGGHEAPTYWPHGDDRATPGPMSIADIVKVAGIAGLKASQLLAKLKAAGFDVTLNQPLAPDHVAALLVMPLATGSAEGAEPTADAVREEKLAQLTIEREAAQSGLDAAMKAFQSYAAIKGVPRRSVSMASMIPGQWEKKLKAIDAAIDAARAAQKGQR